MQCRTTQHRLSLRSLGVFHLELPLPLVVLPLPPGQLDDAGGADLGRQVEEAAGEVGQERGGHLEQESY